MRRNFSCIYLFNNFYFQKMGQQISSCINFLIIDCPTNNLDFSKIDLLHERILIMTISESLSLYRISAELKIPLNKHESHNLFEIIKAIIISQYSNSIVKYKYKASTLIINCAWLAISSDYQLRMIINLLWLPISSEYQLRMITHLLWISIMFHFHH